MKASHFPKAAITPLMAAFFFTTSCVYDVPLDHFCETTWTTSEQPLDGLTLSFVGSGHIEAQLICSSGQSESGWTYGAYEVYDMTACFTGLQVTYGSYTVVIEEAHRTDDLLLIIWHIAESFYGTGPGPEGFDTPGVSFSTRLYRIAE